MPLDLSQVLSKNMLDSNELVKKYQAQLQAANDKVKALEDKLASEHGTLKTELSILADKFSLAQREVSARDATILQLKAEHNNLQQVHAPRPRRPTCAPDALPLSFDAVSMC